MEQNKKILESLAPSLDEIFKSHLTFMHGAYPDDTFFTGFQGVLLGSFQQLSTIEKLYVLECGMNLILAEYAFNYDENLMEAWDTTKRTCKEINSDKIKNTIYLIQIVENYCNVYKIARMSGWHLALFCKKHKIYLDDKEVIEHGESVFKEDLYNAVKEIDADEEFTFSREFYLIHKQAWQNGYLTGFVTSEEGKDIKDHLLLGGDYVRKTDLSDREKLLKLLEEEQQKREEEESELYNEWLNS